MNKNLINFRNEFYKLPANRYGFNLCNRGYGLRTVSRLRQKDDGNSIDDTGRKATFLRADNGNNGMCCHMDYEAIVSVMIIDRLV